MHKISILLVGLLVCCCVSAQELNAKVSVMAGQIKSSVDKKAFQTLQTALTNFLNNRKWTNDTYQQQEKIVCNFFLNLTQDVEPNVYRAVLTIQAGRPVYNSGYISPIINFQDNDVTLKYIEFPENKVASFCFKKIGDVKVIFDKFEPMIGANATYLMPGEQLEIKAGLGAFNASVKPKVFINGNPVTVGDNGVAEIKMPAGGSGGHSLKIDVKYPDPSTGEEKTISKTFDYTVGQPSGVAVMADKMNVLYVGVDNPLTITAGAGSEKVSASINNGRVSKNAGSKYTAKPTEPGAADVNVLVDGKSVGKVSFRVKYLPPATGMVGTFEGGQVSTAQFKAMGGVRAMLQNSEFEALYEVISYTVADLSSPDYNPVANNGPRWSGSAATLVNNLKPGRGVYIDNIKARGPDGRTITLKPLSYILR